MNILTEIYKISSFTIITFSNKSKVKISIEFYLIFIVAYQISIKIIFPNILM